MAIAFLISALFDAMHWSPAARYGVGFIITALVYLVIGGALIISAKNRLAKHRIVPRRSALELKRDKAEHDLISDVHPQVSEIKEQVENVREVVSPKKN